ncbi:YceI family protein [Nocardiopsis baichengensis]|uniref:YceI family protein n=1 Tax=Nocardiopsis baichengensis TaxID=280240 RepID=UPI00034ABFCA|nr:YceI family protein [Nocardiopsis baichengensis]
MVHDHGAGPPPDARPPRPEPGTWYVDPAHSCIIFVARYLGFGRVQGTFGDAWGTVDVAEDPLASKVDATVRTDSLSTGVRARDAHLRSPDLLDTAAYPEMRFTSTALEARGRGRNAFRMYGDLTVHGTTRPLELDCQWGGEAPDLQDPEGVHAHFFAANGSITLSDFGIADVGPSPWGARVIGDTVDIVLEVRVQNADPTEWLRQIGHLQ